jgi:hypothetical protein
MLGHGSATSTVAARQRPVSVWTRLGSGVHRLGSGSEAIWSSGRGTLPRTFGRWPRIAGQHFVEHLVCIGDARAIWIATRLVSGKFSMVLGNGRVMLGSCRWLLGQTFDRAPGVHRSRQRVLDRIRVSFAGRGSPGMGSGGLGLICGLRKWAGSDFFLFSFYFSFLLIKLIYFN